MNAALSDVMVALADLREAVTDAYKAGRIPAEPFVRAGNAIARARALLGDAVPTLELDGALDLDAAEIMAVRNACNSTWWRMKGAIRWDAERRRKGEPTTHDIAPAYIAECEALGLALAKIEQRRRVHPTDSESSA